MPPPRRYDDGLYDEGTYDGPAVWITAEQSLSGLYGPIVLRFGYEERTWQNMYVRDISTAIAGCTVSLDNDRAILRTASFELRADLLPIGFDADQHAVAVFMEVLRTGAWDRYQLGLFVFDQPEKQRDSSYPAEVWTVDASDVSVIMWRSKIATVYRLPAGTSYAATIDAIASGVGLATAIPSGSESVASDQLWGPTTPQGQIAAELAESLNWFTPYATAEGVITTRERIAPSSETPDVVYDTTSEPRFILDVPRGSMRVSVNRTRFPNKVAVVTDDPYRASFYALRENSDPQSSISTVVIGEDILEEKQLPRVVDVSTAIDIADYYLRIADAESQPATLQTLLDPRRGAHETYRVTFETAEVQQLYNVKGWTIKCSAGAAMAHTLRRVRNILVSTPA